MSKKKGVPGYPAVDLLLGDVIDIESKQYVVFGVLGRKVLLYLASGATKETEVDRNSTVRLIRKAKGQPYEAWQRRTSKLLKAMGLSRWPGAVMHEYFFDSVSPEEAAAGFMADHFEAP